MWRFILLNDLAFKKTLKVWEHFVNFMIFVQFSRHDSILNLETPYSLFYDAHAQEYNTRLMLNYSAPLIRTIVC